MEVMGRTLLRGQSSPREQNSSMTTNNPSAKVLDYRSPYLNIAMQGKQRHRYEDEQFTFIKCKSQGKDIWMRRVQIHNMQIQPVSINKQNLKPNLK